MARARSSKKNTSTANLGFEARLWLAVSEVRKQHDEGILVLIGLLPSSSLLHTFSVLAYTAKELDRSVVVKSQIRTVLQAFREALPQLFPAAISSRRPSSSAKTTPTPRTSSTFAAKSSAKATTSAKRSPTNQSIPRPTIRRRANSSFKNGTKRYCRIADTPAR